MQKWGSKNRHPFFLVMNPFNGLKWDLLGNFSWSFHFWPPNCALAVENAWSCRIILQKQNLNELNFCRIIMHFWAFWGTWSNFEGQKWKIHAKIPLGLLVWLKTWIFRGKHNELNFCRLILHFRAFWGAWSNLEGCIDEKFMKNYPLGMLLRIETWIFRGKHIARIFVDNRAKWGRNVARVL